MILFYFRSVPNISSPKFDTTVSNANSVAPLHINQAIRKSVSVSALPTSVPSRVYDFEAQISSSTSSSPSLQHISATFTKSPSSPTLFTSPESSKSNNLTHADQADKTIAFDNKKGAFLVLRNRSSSLNYGPSNLPTDNRPVTSAVHVSSAVTPSTHVGDLFNSTPIHKLRKETLSGIYKSGSSNPQEFILDVSPESSNSPYSLEKEANFTSTPKHRPTLQSPIVFPPPNTLGNNSVYESANGSNSRSSTNTISESYKPALLLLAKEESKEYEPGHNDTYNNSSSDESKLIAPVLPFSIPQSRSLSSLADQKIFSILNDSKTNFNADLGGEFEFKSLSTPSSPTDAFIRKISGYDNGRAPMILSHVEPIFPVPKRLARNDNAGISRQRVLSDSSIQLIEERYRHNSGINEQDSDSTKLNFQTKQGYREDAVHTHKPKLHGFANLGYSFSSKKNPNINNRPGPIIKKSLTVPSSLNMGLDADNKVEPIGLPKQSFQLPDMFQRKDRQKEPQSQNRTRKSLNFTHPFSMVRLRPRSKTQPLSVPDSLLLPASEPKPSNNLPVIEPISKLTTKRQSLLSLSLTSSPAFPSDFASIEQDRNEEPSPVDMTSGLGILHVPKRRRGSANHVLSSISSEQIIFPNKGANRKSSSSRDRNFFSKNQLSEASQSFSYHFNNNSSDDGSYYNPTSLSPKPNMLLDTPQDDLDVPKDVELPDNQKKSASRVFKLGVNFPVRAKTTKETVDKVLNEAVGITEASTSNRYENNISSLDASNNYGSRKKSFVELLDKVRGRNSRRRSNKSVTALESSASEMESEEEEGYTELGDTKKSNTVSAPIAIPINSTRKSLVDSYNDACIFGLPEPFFSKSELNSSAELQSHSLPEESHIKRNHTASIFKRHDRNSFPSNPDKANIRSDSSSPARSSSATRRIRRNLSFGSAFTSLSNGLSSSAPDSLQHQIFNHGSKTERNDQLTGVDPSNSSNTKEMESSKKVSKSRTNSVGESFLPSMPDLIVEDIPPLPVHPWTGVRRNRSKSRKNYGIEFRAPGRRTRAKTFSGNVGLGPRGGYSNGRSFSSSYSSSGYESNSGVLTADNPRYSNQHKRYSPVQEEEEEGSDDHGFKPNIQEKELKDSEITEKDEKGKHDFGYGSQLCKSLESQETAKVDFETIEKGSDSDRKESDRKGLESKEAVTTQLEESNHDLPVESMEITTKPVLAGNNEPRVMTLDTFEPEKIYLEDGIEAPNGTVNNEFPGSVETKQERSVTSGSISPEGFIANDGPSSEARSIVESTKVNSSLSTNGIEYQQRSPTIKSVVLDNASIQSGLKPAETTASLLSSPSSKYSFESNAVSVYKSPFPPQSSFTRQDYASVTSFYITANDETGTTTTSTTNVSKLVEQRPAAVTKLEIETADAASIDLNVQDHRNGKTNEDDDDDDGSNDAEKRSFANVSRRLSVMDRSAEDSSTLQLKDKKSLVSTKPMYSRDSKPVSDISGTIEDSNQLISIDKPVPHERTDDISRKPNNTPVSILTFYYYLFRYEFNELDGNQKSKKKKIITDQPTSQFRFRPFQHPAIFRNSKLGLWELFDFNIIYFSFII